jgi:hypothetical protein
VLTELEAALNINGNQRIAKLQFSVLDPGHLKDARENHIAGGQSDERMQHIDIRLALRGQGSGEDTSDISEKLDIDVFPPESQDTRLRFKKIKKAAHVFGQAECLRIPNGDDRNQKIEEDEGKSRRQRQAAGLPVIARFVMPLHLLPSFLLGIVQFLNAILRSCCTSFLFPLVPTFPVIFPTLGTSSVAVHSSLSTTTAVAGYIKAQQNLVRKAVSPDEREALANGLGEIAEAYEEGWDSGGEEDSDD